MKQEQEKAKDMLVLAMDDYSWGLVGGPIPIHPDDLEHIITEFEPITKEYVENVYDKEINKTYRGFRYDRTGKKYYERVYH